MVRRSLTVGPDGARIPQIHISGFVYTDKGVAGILKDPEVASAVGAIMEKWTPPNKGCQAGIRRLCCIPPIEVSSRNCLLEEDVS